MPETPAFRDRSRRLVAFGIAVIGVGVLVCFVGLVHLLLPLAARLLPSAPPSPDAAAILMGALLYGSLGALLVWAGIGSVRLRRWVRPLMLSLAWIWLITGLLATPLAAVLLDDVVQLAALQMEAPPAELLALVRLVMLGATVIAGVVVPALLIWAYRDPDVGRTCAARHAARTWTDACPLPVLGLSVCLALAALVFLPAVLRPVVPLFGLLVTGWPGGLLIFGSSVVAAYLAWSTYRLRLDGFWGTTAALVAIGVSTAVTFAVVKPLEVYRAMGYPEEILAAWSGSPLAGRPLVVGSTIVLTLLSLAYMAQIRKHFSRGAC